MFDLLLVDRVPVVQRDAAGVTRVGVHDQYVNDIPFAVMY
jgi:hypothetical protein